MDLKSCKTSEGFTWSIYHNISIMQWDHDIPACLRRKANHYFSMLCTRQFYKFPLFFPSRFYWCLRKKLYNLILKWAQLPLSVICIFKCIHIWLITLDRQTEEPTVQSCPAASDSHLKWHRQPSFRGCTIGASLRGGLEKNPPSKKSTEHGLSVHIFLNTSLM